MSVRPTAPHHRQFRSALLRSSEHAAVYTDFPTMSAAPCYSDAAVLSLSHSAGSSPWHLPRNPMRSTHLNRPTLLVNPTTSCPRCARRRIVALAVDLASSFTWRECEDCGHLWALPQGWTPHPEPFFELSANKTAK